MATTTTLHTAINYCEMSLYENSPVIDMTIPTIVVAPPSPLVDELKARLIFHLS